jgi:two-component system chemotaxis response regulator CheY
MKSGKSIRVLVVDDAFYIRELISLILRNEGYEVIKAANGKDALHELKGTNIDLLITDLNMPEMNGIELVESLRNIPDGKSIPVLMVTSENYESIRKKALQAGVNEWILKPFIPKQLIESVKKYVPAIRSEVQLLSSSFNWCLKALYRPSAPK